MKKLSFLLLFIILFMVNASAQNIPRGMKYQAVARDLKGEVLSNAKIELRINLLSKADAIQSSHYSEIHSVVTNQLGLFTLVVGEGKMESGDFEKVPWSSADIWMEIQIKTNGQSDFTSISNSQLLAVPYAYYAATAGVLAGAILQGNTAAKGFENPRCPCEGGLSQIKVLYLGPTGVTINVYRNKNLTDLLRTFTGVTSGSILEINAVNFPDGKLKNDTYFQVMSTGIAVVEIPTECEEFKEPWEFSLGETFGNFSVLSHRDRKNGAECTVCDIRKEWQVGGNGLMDLCNILGTKSYTDLVFITNNIERLRITKDGEISMKKSLELGENLTVKGHVYLNTNKLTGGFGSTTNYGEFTVDRQSPTYLTGELTVFGETWLKNKMKVDGVTDLNSTLNVNNMSSTNLTGNLNVDKISIFRDLVYMENTTSSSTSYGGALTVQGGVAIRKELNIGGITKIEDATETHFTGNGALVVAGGVGIGRSLRVGEDMRVSKDLNVDLSAVIQKNLVVNENTTLKNLTVTGSSALNSLSLNNLDVTGNAGIGVRYNNVRLTVSAPASYEYPFYAEVAGTANKFHMNKDGQLYLRSIKAGPSNNANNYAMWLDAQNHGLVIRLNEKVFPDATNKYVSFWGTDGASTVIRGRIEGQTAANLATSFEYIWMNAVSAAELALKAAMVIACAAQLDALEVVVLGAEGAVMYTKWAELAANKVAKQGVSYESGAGDYAEWLVKSNPAEKFSYGDIVGVRGGQISKDLTNADHFMVISMNPIVLGNMPEAGKEKMYEKVAFLGQVPIKIRNKAAIGDYILSSGLNDGFGLAVNPKKITLDQIPRIVGVSWSETETTSGFSYVNGAIGINVNDVVPKMKQQQAEIKEIKTKVNELISYLKEKDPAFKGSLFELNSNEILIEEEKPQTVLPKPSIVKFSKISMDDIILMMEKDSDLVEKVLSDTRTELERKGIDYKQFDQTNRLLTDKQYFIAYLKELSVTKKN